MRSVKNLGKYIADTRKLRGLSQAELAEKLGVAPQTVSKWETGVGYPDLAMFPEIARALCVSMDDLFGEKTGVDDNGTKYGFPETKNGLAFVYSWENRGCFSDKKVLKIEEDKVSFTDGSTAELFSNTVTNRGPGNIRIFEEERLPGKNEPKGPTAINREVIPFDSIKLEVSGSGVAEILSGKENEFRVEAEGPSTFIASLEIGVSKGVLSVSNSETQHSNNNNNGGERKIRIFAGFTEGENLEVSIQGSGICNVNPAFKKTKLTISGSGSINCADVGEVRAGIRGSGDINLGNGEKAYLDISGSGDIDMESAVSPAMSVRGSGDISVSDVSGDIRLTISGCGDISLSGNADRFDCDISGAGDVNGSNLTVKTADIHTSGGADITIGRIIESSVERLSKDATLTVKQRG